MTWATIACVDAEGYVCYPEHLYGYAVFEGTSLATHFADPHKAVVYAKSLGVPTNWWDAENDRSPAYEDFTHLAEHLTFLIHQGLPEIDDPEARVDDFDNHPLSPIREALVDNSTYDGVSQ